MAYSLRYECDKPPRGFLYQAQHPLPGSGAFLWVWLDRVPTTVRLLVVLY